jgi:membrane protein implicated in regulation of membrane protease activity
MSMVLVVLGSILISLDLTGAGAFVIATGIIQAVVGK